MPQTAPVARLSLNLPEHVVRVLEDWTYNELHSTPQEAVESFLKELCVNGQLRLAVTEQLRRYSEDV
jgi:hypothetical protein